MRDYERKAVADAAFDAWRSGQNYDDAWDAAQDAIDYYQPLDKFDAEEIAERAAKREGR